MSDPCNKPRRPREREWFDLESASALARVPEFLLERAVDAGELRGACLGNELRFHRSWIMRWLAEYGAEVHARDSAVERERSR